VAKMFMISGAVEYLPLFPALADGLAALARSGAPVRLGVKGQRGRSMVMRVQQR
jgi:hypothetical protein